MLCHMRTTIRLPDELYDEVRRRSVDRGVTVTSFIERALRQALERPTRASVRPYAVSAFKGNGTLPGVDLNDSARLLDLMEG